MNAPDRDDDYVAALRSRLPDDADKARVRQRLAALGVGGAATSLAVGSQAQVAAAAKWKLLAAGKVFLAAGGIAVLGASLHLATVAAPRSVSVPRGVQAVASEPAAPPAAAPGAPALEADEPAPSEPPTRPRRARPRAQPQDTLSAENALLSAAVRALNAGDEGRAAALLDEHERRFPGGLLRAERERARRRLVR